jgi:hypothetical protein
LHVTKCDYGRYLEIIFSFRYIIIISYKTIILTAVMYGWETLSLTLRQEHRLRVPENRVLKILIPTRDEVMRGWRKLHNERLQNLYSSPSITAMIMSRTMR